MESLYRRYRFPPEIISHAVWLNHRFTLSFRDVEDLLAERGITVSYEAIRSWCRKLDQPMLVLCDDGKVDSATPGTWTKCSSQSAANVIIFGERWTRTATSWIF